MKKLFVLFVLSFVSFSGIAQNSADTVITTIYEISGNNRLTTIEVNQDTTYAYYYRDLKHLGEIRSINLKTKDDVKKFIDLCYKALEQDKSFVTENYNISRNKLSKTVVRINDKKEGYSLITEKDLHLMENAFKAFIHE